MWWMFFIELGMWGQIVSPMTIKTNPKIIPRDTTARYFSMGCWNKREVKPKKQTSRDLSRLFRGSFWPSQENLYPRIGWRKYAGKSKMRGWKASKSNLIWFQDISTADFANKTIPLPQGTWWTLKAEMVRPKARAPPAWAPWKGRRAAPVAGLTLGHDGESTVEQLMIIGDHTTQYIGDFNGL